MDTKMKSDAILLAIKFYYCALNVNSTTYFS